MDHGDHPLGDEGLRTSHDPPPDRVLSISPWPAQRATYIPIRTFETACFFLYYFDWDNKGSSGPQDGLADHVGIVEKVENGMVYTVEGNSGDSCRENRYAIGHYEIYGYGTPAY